MSYFSIKGLWSGEVHQNLGSVFLKLAMVEKSTSCFERVKVILYKRIVRLPFGRHADPSTLMYLLPIWGRYLFDSFDSATHSENLSEAWEAETKILKQIASPTNLFMSSLCYADYGWDKLAQSF